MLLATLAVNTDGYPTALAELIGHNHEVERAFLLATSAEPRKHSTMQPPGSAPVPVPVPAS